MTAEAVAAAPPLSRREFLYYLWGASMALFMAEMGGALVWFSFPRFKEGEFGGIITVSIADIPAPDAGPKDFPEARIWLVNLGQGRLTDERQPEEYTVKAGIKAMYKICVHLGCLYKWVPTNDRFECPCHGSKFLTTGARIDGPANRNLDAFPFEFVDEQGNVL
ncbi:MAG: Rieske 2Fe-2S domain-containing protein, partial [Anaerolineales bacterium]|nr:Rieske 2Fe-2S domain-containing protein [Anaerolineales bacterium]